MAARKKRRTRGAGAKKEKTKARNADRETKVERRRAIPWGWIAAAAVALGIVVWQLYPQTHGPVVPELLVARVIESHPHDPGAFTQGLLWHDGWLYESTGRYGESSLRRVDLETGEVDRRVDLPDDLFAEGLALAPGRFVQLTWQSGKALVWDAESLERVDEHDYRGEGWGLCYDGERLVMSDGTAWLTFRDPETFETIDSVRVTRAGRPLRKLNELECVDGLVYANVWMDDHIARIDPDTGAVTGWIDASGLLDASDRRGGEDVLNGIAHDPATGRFMLTGKLWPLMFEVELVPAG